MEKRGQQIDYQKSLYDQYKKCSNDRYNKYLNTENEKISDRIVNSKGEYGKKIMEARCYLIY